MFGSKKAFSIIELLVVIVIIGILATLIIAGYGFVTGDATKQSIQNDLTNASEQLDVFNYQNKAYPQTINCASANSSTNLCIKVASGSSFSYYTDTAVSPQRYCYSVTNGSTTYYIMNNTTRTPASGGCVEQSNLVFNYDFANSSSYSGSGTTVYDISGKGKNATLSSSLVSYVSNSGGALNLNGNLSGASQLSPPTNGAFYVQSVSNNANTPRTVEIIYQLLNPSTHFGPLFGSPDAGGWKERIFPDSQTIGLVDSATPTAGYNYLTTNLPNPTTNTNIQAITYSYNGTTAKGYRNGVYQSTVTMTAPMSTGPSSYYFGYQCGGSVCSSVNMYLYVVRFYDSELTATQVTNNFNALRSRYGL